MPLEKREIKNKNTSNKKETSTIMEKERNKGRKKERKVNEKGN